VLEESTRFFVANLPRQLFDLMTVTLKISPDYVAGEAAGEAAKLLRLQMTGGSSTVADAYEKMRVAAAMARECILSAAESKLGIPREKLDALNGQVIWQDRPLDPPLASYSSLAEAAAKVPLASAVKLKCPQEWRYLGKDMRRIDMVAKCTGTAVYGIDLKMDGMVYATVCTNPRGGALMNYDAIEAAAQASKGVLKVVKIKRGADIIGFGVIANNTWRAFRAARHSEDPRSFPKPEWGPALYPETTEKMFAVVAKSFDDKNPISTTVKNNNTGKNVDAALAAAGGVIKEYRVPYLAHAPLEPMNAVVQFKDGRLDIWTGTQIPTWLKNNAARTANIAPENVTLHSQYSGGSFGRRLEDDYVWQAIQLAKEYQNVPIKMTWTREEDMTHDFPRPLAIARMQGVVKDGHVDTYDIRIASPSVTSSQLGRQKENLLRSPSRQSLLPSLPLTPVGALIQQLVDKFVDVILDQPDVFIVAGAYDQPYQIPNYRVRGYRADEMVPISSWRSVGASGNAFFHECFLDELIYKAGADPLDERLRLCSDESSRKVLKQVGEMSSWKTKIGPNRGRGLAFTLSFGVPVAEVVEVTHTNGSIKIDKVFVAVDAGPVLDPVNFENQIQGAVIWGLGHAMNAELTYKSLPSIACQIR
jgi:isoquinoline 1-oxidoreductase subunit beta